MVPTGSGGPAAGLRTGAGFGLGLGLGAGFRTGLGLGAGLRARCFFFFGRRQRCLRRRLASATASWPDARALRRFGAGAHLRFRAAARFFLTESGIGLPVG